MFERYSEETVIVKDIEHDDHFRISRNFTGAELITSIKTSGMLEKPFLVKRGKLFYPLTCHNRIKIISDEGIESIDCFILESPSKDVFFKNSVLKVFRNETGPVGRLRAMNILRNDFNVEGKALSDYAKRMLKIPQEISTDQVLVERILQLPQPLRNYLDIRDVSYKIIRDLSRLDDKFLSEMNRWIEKIQIRLNLFKMIVDFLFDISRRDGELKPLDSEVLGRMDDKELYNYIFKIRYPKYAVKKSAADDLITSLTGNGVTIDFPEYFERDIVMFKFTLKKKEGSRRLAEMASALDKSRIDDLLSLL